MFGRQWLAILLAAQFLLALPPAGVRAGDVTWLAKVQNIPANAPRERLGRIEPLLVDADGQSITTREGWERRRKSLRDEWLKFLGPMPDLRPAVKLQKLKTEMAGQAVRELVRYEGEPGQFVEGYLLRPFDLAKDQRRPAIVALHQTTKDTIDEIAGVSGPPDMRLGLKLAELGFIVFCPRCFLWQDATDLNAAVAKHRERHPQSLGMAKMLYDAQRGVDVLASLPEVDANCIGAVGHSLGAKEVLYLAAFDERIKASVASEGGLAFRSTNWDAPWYLGQSIRDERFPLNHHQLLALIAPRPFLVLGGETGPGAADGDRSWPLLEAALPVWRLYGEPSRLGLLNHGRGHSLSPREFELVADWLKTYLQPTTPR